MRKSITPSGKETFFEADELIVSKTDLRGIITYANDVFYKTAGYTEKELWGQPHNIIRHPNMPRCIFKLLWDTVQDQKEIFAYVLNLAKNGDHYWVFAHVTPSYDTQGKHVGYHSSRRVPYPDALEKVVPLYKTLLAEESKYNFTDEGMTASTKILTDTLSNADMDYSQFVFSLSRETCLDASLN
jgi:PAS domain S-box-containing protein